MRNVQRPPAKLQNKNTTAQSTLGDTGSLTKRVLSHARENAARDVLEDEEFYNSCEDDTTSESESSDSDGENSYVEESFEVLFVPEEDIQHVN